MKCCQITISGEIMGEGIRFKAMHFACKNGLKGYVMYSKPDEILIEAEGEEEQLEQFLQSCQSGSFSLVPYFTSIIETEVKGFQIFEIRPSINVKLDSYGKSTLLYPFMTFLRKYISLT